MSVRVDMRWLLNTLQIDFKVNGGMAWACCPAREHRDSTPSWRVILDTSDPRYGQHRCYGCGFGGYAVHLVAEALELDRGEARNWLAERGNSGPLPQQVELVTQLGMPNGYVGF